MSYIDAQGATIAYLDTSASPNAYVQVLQVLGIDPPTSERSQRETTDLDATARTFRSGLIDHQDMTLRLEWDEALASHAALNTFFDNNTEKTWRITVTDPSPNRTYTFNGSITRVDLDELGVDGIQTATVVVKPSGAVTRA